MRDHDHRYRLTTGVVVTSCVLLCACSRAKEEEPNPVVTVDVAPVLGSTIQRKVTTDAVLYPLRQAAIVPKIAAPVKKFYVNRGDHVHAGQVLAELENADLAASLVESQAAYTQAEAAYQTAVRATLPEEVQKAELDLRAAKDALDAEQSVYDSRQNLFKQGAIAQKDVNDAQVALVQARNQQEIAQKHLENLQGFANAQALKGAEAQRDGAKGHYENAEAQLSYSKIVSPIDGVVTDRPVYAGEMPPSSGPLVTVMDLSQIVARAHIAPAEAAAIKVGDDANLIIPNNAPIPGKVTQISPALDATGTTVEVWVQAANTNDVLKPGTSLRLEIVAETAPGALVVPQAAILTSSSGSTSVIVIDNDNKPHKTSVDIGIRDAGMVQVTGGLQSGQRVVTAGAFELAKLDSDVLDKTKVQIQAPKEDEDDDDDK